ncbi:FecR family protein [Formosa sp. PL04]|uniref:FecR family protein n=1 Tax=Formosa sp. PL04 TaxID=3081755 RepID=UPI00298223D5|nr:FecR family protein [Formosa sp. PL04]MDW5290973.1 FecR family protein [Formosa sp. PL04]
MKDKSTNFFQNLIDRYINNKSTNAEHKILENFFDSKAENLSWETNKFGNKELLKARLKGEIDRKIKKQSFTNNRYKYISAAAGILIMVGWFLFSDISPKSKVFATTQTIDSLLLNDGSKIILGPNSILEYPSSFKNDYRSVELIKGNAFFKIARDTTKPFEVKHPELSTTVLGTSFTINTNKKNISVLVMTGKVSVRSKNNLMEILNPTDRATFNYASNELKLDQVLNSLPWYAKEIKFRNSALVEISEIIENRFGYHFKFENEILKEKIVTLTIDSNTTIQNFVDQLNYITNLKFKIKDHDIKIKE